MEGTLVLDPNRRRGGIEIRDRVCHGRTVDGRLSVILLLTHLLVYLPEGILPDLIYYVCFVDVTQTLYQPGVMNQLTK